MPMFNSPTAFFVGNLNAKDKAFEKTFFENARKKGYERFIEPCSGEMAMSQIALEVEKNGYDGKQSLIPVRKILGGETCSKQAGETIKKAVDKMVKNGEAKSKWEAMERLAERYLNGEK